MVVLFRELAFFYFTKLKKEVKQINRKKTNLQRRFSKWCETIQKADLMDLFTGTWMYDFKQTDIEIRNIFRRFNRRLKRRHS